MARKKAPKNVLVVKAFSYPTSTEGNGPEDNGVQPLADVAGPAFNVTSAASGSSR